MDSGFPAKRDILKFNRTVEIFREENHRTVSNHGKTSYHEEYPEADTDNLTEEKRLHFCQTGFDHVLKHENGKHFLFENNKKTDKLEVYVLVNPSITGLKSDHELEVRPAYQCPTTPPLYIHLDCDWSRQDPTIWVIIKDSRLPFNFNHINEFRLVLLDEIREANAKEIEDTSKENVGTSAFDDVEISDEQRMQMCKRVMNMAPEMGAHFSEDVTFGMTKYYTLIEPQEEKVVIDAKLDSSTEQNPDLEEDDETEAETNSDSSDNTSTNSSTPDNSILEAFICPTEPEIYVSVSIKDEKENTLWGVVKKSDVNEHPSFNIMVYELIVTNSIHKLPKEDEMSKKQWERYNLPSRQNKPIKTEDSPIGRILEMSVTRDAGIDTDELTEEERRFICEKAMKTVLGENVKFTKASPGRSEYYRFYKTNEYGIVGDKRSYEVEKVVKAFSCPTELEGYICLQANYTENIATVIVSGKNLA